jgi:hypothetical protein
MNNCLIHKVAVRLTTSGKGVVLAKRHKTLNNGTKLLSLRHSRLKTLVLEERGSEIAQQSLSVADISA